MANLNKVMLIGRLTRDPEVRTFSNGGKVANLGFAVNNRKKNQQTGEWEDEPCFLDVKAFNSSYERGRKLADLCEQYLKKGHQAYIEGHLVLEQWTNQEGQKQSKIKVVLDDLQFLEPKGQGGMSDGGMSRSTPAATRKPANGYAPENGNSYGEPEHEPLEPPPTTEADIPF
jgi:single-strand DNA-binding protein